MNAQRTEKESGRTHGGRRQGRKQPDQARRRDQVVQGGEVRVDEASVEDDYEHYHEKE
jgi:hypothetical protein